jgi:Holliday junction DNA helicase RuvA
MAMGGDLGARDLVVDDTTPAPSHPPKAPSGAAQAEALSALQNLGYARPMPPAPWRRSRHRARGGDARDDPAALRLLAPKE